MTFPTKIKIKELKREIAKRREVYPHLVADGRLKPEIAEFRIMVLNAILDDYERFMRGGEQGGLFQ